MRRIKLQMQISIDGFVSTGPNDEQQWVTWAWDEIQEDVLETIGSCDTILIGRTLAVDFIPHWQSTVTNQKDPMHALAEHIVRCQKLVFTKSLHEAKWDNTKIINGDLQSEIPKLKTSMAAADMFVCGGTSFVSSLIEHDLIDEYNLYVNPVALGKGESIFRSLGGFRRLELSRSKAYSSGIVLNQYVRVRS